MSYSALWLRIRRAEYVVAVKPEAYEQKDDRENTPCGGCDLSAARRGWRGRALPQFELRDPGLAARGLGVRNGTRGTVTDIDERIRALTVHTDDGADVELPESYSTRRVRHAYALTGHKAQGKTVTQAFVLADQATYREWAYTALSRGQEANRLYVVGRESTLPDDVSHGRQTVEDPLAPMVRSAARSSAKSTALEAADRVELERLQREAADLSRLLEAQRARTQESGAAPSAEDEQTRRRRRRDRERGRDQGQDREP